MSTRVSIPNVAPGSVQTFLATPGNWPKIVLSSHSVAGAKVDSPLSIGEEVDEIFGLPPVLPLRVVWTCTENDLQTGALQFESPAGLAGVASNCRMQFAIAAGPEDGSSIVELDMSYDASNALAIVAAPVLAIDNAIAVKLLLPDALRRPSASPLGTMDPIAGPLVALARRTGALPAAEADGWTGEPTSWAKADSLPQRLSELSQRRLGGFKLWLAERVAGEYDRGKVDASIDGAIRGSGCVVFVFASCPFCKKAIELLDSRGATYELVTLDGREDGAAIRARLGARTGRTSVPSIWIGGEYVGGLNDGVPDDESCPGLVRLDARGELELQLRAAGAL